jgi:outer membrane protein/adhesin transport system outer membrane protein
MGIVTAALAVVGMGPATAETLDEALSRAYTSNPALGTARAQLRAQDEAVPQALAQTRPQTALVGSAGPAWTRTSLVQTAPGERPPWMRLNSRSVGLSVTQPLYKGGQIESGISQAENQVLAQRASLLDTEQSILLQAATAYFDVGRDVALLDLQVNFESFQKRDLEAYRDRFRVGEITQTDVSLQEAQLSSATAARVAAEGTLENTRATYAALIGSLPGKLVLPRLKLPLPASLDETVVLARAHNPQVVNATYTEAAARDAVDIADGGLLPNLSVTASVGRNLDKQVPNDFSNGASVIATLTVPLDNGAVAAKARQARQSAGAARMTVEQVLRTVEQNAVTAWQGLATTRASIGAYQAAVRANELAADGMRQQVAVGASTVIDLLNTEQTLLNARVNLVKAHHDENVAIFSVLAAVGGLSAQTLKLPVPYYDYEAYYHAVRNKWFGIGIDQ